MSLLLQVENEALSGKKIDFGPGDKISVHVRIKEKEGDKGRIQEFEGTVIAIRGSGTRTSFIVRKISENVGVERIFPLHAPSVEKIEVKTRHVVRRAKLYYLRALRGKAARLKEARK